MSQGLSLRALIIIAGLSQLLKRGRPGERSVVRAVYCSGIIEAQTASQDIDKKGKSREGEVNLGHLWCEGEIGDGEMRTQG